MADYTFFTNPMARGQIARWALHEAGAEHDQLLVDWKAKPATFFAAKPLGKVPALVHHTEDGDRVVIEAAAICLYLADMHAEAGLPPNDAEMAHDDRWTFSASGPVEPAVTSRNLRLQPAPEQEVMARWGNFDCTMCTFEGHPDDVTWVCGDGFTMADVYVSRAVDGGLNFGIMPPCPAFVGYADRLQKRAAYKAEDNTLIAEMRK